MRVPPPKRPANKAAPGRLSGITPGRRPFLNLCRGGVSFVALAPENNAGPAPSYSRMPVPRLMKSTAIANRIAADSNMMLNATTTLTSLVPRKP